MAASPAQSDDRGIAQREHVLGVPFFNGSVADAVTESIRLRGLTVIPASPALLKLKFDDAYRRALQQAELALADSVLLTRLWRLVSGRRLRSISGVAFLRSLLESSAYRNDNITFWVVGSNAARDKAIIWLRTRGSVADDDGFHVTGTDGAGSDNHSILLKVEERRPRHVVIALGTGEEALGLYLREYLLYRPSIYCVGAALGFLTGADHSIPQWAESYRLGWVVRFIAQPRLILPRLGIAAALFGMVLRYRAKLPTLRRRWSDL
jgi:UDP-N-acetyl-D-mannosaminuronic acid transferase (WecB/TagA/CpsF family)